MNKDFYMGRFDVKKQRKKHHVSYMKGHEHPPIGDNLELESYPKSITIFGSIILSGLTH